jgi:hypothetical protein
VGYFMMESFIIINAGIIESFFLVNMICEGGNGENSR